MSTKTPFLKYAIHKLGISASKTVGTLILTQAESEAVLSSLGL